jgi:aminopeptidase-like protein
MATSNAAVSAVQEIGAQAYDLATQLFPICRSLTGEGNRLTLRILAEHIPLQIHEIASGTDAFDWKVPREWNIHDAYIKNLQGERVVDFKRCNLHVMGYSVPVKGVIPIQELKAHLISDPNCPDWVPYRTSYYKEAWGFCVTHKQLLAMQDSEYEVCIDSTLADGSMTFGELFLPGASEAEVLISTHICHPSLCNDNLSGIAVAVFLAKALAARQRRYSYRFLFVPGSIGAIYWLSRNEERAAKIQHGLVLSNLGDGGAFVYKKSRRGDAAIDRSVANVLEHSGQEHRIIGFSPYGYDERQYCSPGFNLPVGRLSRTPHGEFPQYHTSADNLDLVRPEYLGESYAKCLEILDLVEADRYYKNQNPKCEPLLGKRNLYGTVGGLRHLPDQQLAMLWVLNLSDGNYSLLDISERSGLPFTTIKAAADALAGTDLLRECAH